MEMLQRVRKTDLARNTRQIIRDVLRGQTAVVESHGQPEVAIVDIVDYYLQRAALYYYSKSPQVDKEAGLSDEDFAQAASEEERYNLVLAHYLGEAISLGRTAELLGLPWVDLRMRLARLGIPLRLGPQSIEELRAEIEAIEKWEKR
jgi:predicted HTH domain antitoxin